MKWSTMVLGSNRRRFTYAYKIPAETKAVVILYLQLSGKEFFFTDEAGNKLRSSLIFATIVGANFLAKPFVVCFGGARSEAVVSLKIRVICICHGGGGLCRRRSCAFTICSLQQLQPLSLSLPQHILFFGNAALCGRILLAIFRKAQVVALHGHFVACRGILLLD